jgi:hypothetical protein
VKVGLSQARPVEWLERPQTFDVRVLRRNDTVLLDMPSTDGDIRVSIV